MVRVKVEASDKSEDGKIRVRHIGVFLYLTYMLWIVLTEWINFIPKVLAGLSPAAGIAEVVALLAVIGLFYCGWGRLEFDLKKPEKGKVICAVILALMGTCISVFPDSGFDTLNYHIIAQNPKFENYFVEDFGYGNFQVWGFRLCDRMFFYFRKLLGYRYGTMLNTVSIIISFTQVYDILGSLTGEGKEDTAAKRIVCNRALWALAIILPLDVIMMFGSYCVDAAVLPVGLFIISMISDTMEDRVDSTKIALFAFCCGLMIGGKLTNIVYVVPCVIAFVVIHIRDFRLRDWFISILLGMSGCLEYLIFNTICTGNPIFPYYNTIFKSVYYPVADFKDGRWGGQNLFEKAFWAVYAVFKPSYRLSEIYDSKSLLLLLGLVTGAVLAVFSVIKIIRREVPDKRITVLLLIAFFSTELWGFTTGISRYFIFGRVLWGILAYYGVKRVVARYPNIITYAGGDVLSLGITACVVMNTVLAVSIGGWSATWRSFAQFRDELPKVMRDHYPKEQTDITMFALTDPMSMGIAELIEPDAYVFQISYNAETEYDEMLLMGEKIRQYGYGIDLRRAENLDVAEYTEGLAEKGLVIESVSEFDTPLGAYQGIRLKVND